MEIPHVNCGAKPVRIFVISYALRFLNIYDPKHWNIVKLRLLGMLLVNIRCALKNYISQHYAMCRIFHEKVALDRRLLDVSVRPVLSPTSEMENDWFKYILSSHNYFIQDSEK